MALSVPFWHSSAHPNCAIVAHHPFLAAIAKLKPLPQQALFISPRIRSPFRLPQQFFQPCPVAGFNREAFHYYRSTNVVAQIQTLALSFSLPWRAAWQWKPGSSAGQVVGQMVTRRGVQQQPDEQEQQYRLPSRSAPSSTRLPEGGGADPAAIPSCANG